MNRKNRVLQGSIVAVLQYIVQFILQLALAPLILSLAGQAILGVYAIFIQILGYLSLIQLGIGVSTSRFLSQAFGRKDKGLEFRTSLNAARILYVASGIIYLLCAILISNFLNLFIQSDQRVIEQLRISVLAMGVWTMLRSFFLVYTPALAATQELARANISNLVGNLARVVCSILFLLAGFGLASLVAAWILAEAVTSLCNSIWFLNRNSNLRCSLNFHNLERMPALLRMSVHGLAMGISWRLVAGSDSLVVGALQGPSAVSVFYSTQLPTTFGYTLVNQVPDNASPALNELYVRLSSGNLRHVYLLLHRYTLVFSSLLAVGLLLLNKAFILLWLGPQQYAGDVMTVCLAAFAVMITVTKVNQTYILVTGRMRTLTLVLLLEGGLNLLLSLALGNRLGLSGVIQGTVIAHTVTLIYSQRRALCELQVSWRDFLYHSVKPVLVPVSSGVAVALPLAHLFPPTIRFNFILITSVLIVTHLGVAYFVCLHSEEKLWVNMQVTSVLSVLRHRTLSPRP